MKIPVSAPKNAWFDAENVDDADLTLEQNYNDQIQSAIINNHFGSGVLPDVLVQQVLFDSEKSNGLLDGKAISTQAQPSDTSNGNQLEVELINSSAAGNRAVKVLVIGLDFQNNLQYDRFSFHTNEKQVSEKHYKSILSIFFNDFVGAANQSFNLGGRIVIKEANPFSVSRDCIMTSQDVEPNIFFRDFFVATGGTLTSLLSTALPTYNIDNLNIKTGYTQLRSLNENDVISQIGVKFLATTNNIQKISLLMATINNNPLQLNNLVWTGDLIVSLYQLQTSVSCQTDITPGLAIEFSPSNIPLVQLSVDYNSMLASGVQLNTVPQPVDFIFSNTSVGSGLSVVPGKYYAITVKRAGSADTCKIQFAIGSNASETIRETLFNGDIWTDVPEECPWFQCYTDAAKVSDGQAYDNGHGIQIPKTNIDPTTQLTIDYSLDNIQFVRNDLYYALAQATTQKSVPVQDERTGNDVLSRQQYVPTITLLNTTALSNIQNISDPLIIGTIADKNVKSVNSAPVQYAFHEYGMVKNEAVIKVIDDTSDGYRYDTAIIELLSELVNGNLNYSKLIPNVSNQSLAYKVSKAELITQIYGDVNGDGIVDESDLLAFQDVIGSDLNFIPTYNEYITLTTNFNTSSMVSWQVVDPAGPTIIASGADGYLTVNPLDGTKANFASASANFVSITNLGNFNLVISGQISNPGNNGTFRVIDLVDNHNITIKKQFYTSDKILEILRSDINGDMIANATDLNLLTDYITFTAPFPPTSSPANKIGTSFKTIRLTFENIVDRADDYSSLATNRSTALHILPDLYLDGYSSFAGRDLKNNPMTFSVSKQLSWEEWAVESNSSPRLVSNTFEYQSGAPVINENESGIIERSFPEKPAFDGGRNDFFVPNNLVIGLGGEIINSDGYLYKIDFETSDIILEVPSINFDSEKTFNVFSDFVANYSNDGKTRLGYSAMRFADNSFVGMDGLTKNQVRFSVSIVSFSPLLDGVDPDEIEGIVVDGRIGINMDYDTGLLSLNFSNLFQDAVLMTRTTKVQITVSMKKAGWVNKGSIFINSAKMTNLLGL